MDFDSLIPQRILDLCRFDQFEVEIALKSTAAENRWPRTQIWINDHLMYDDLVINRAVYQIQEKISLDDSQVLLRVVYLDKTDLDTIVDEDGRIIQNKTLEIIGLKINGIDLIANQLVYDFGNYTMKLSDQKRDYFQSIGINHEHSHSLEMSENGEWCWKIPVPVTSGFVSRMSHWEKHEQWLDSELYHKIYNKIQDVMILQQLIKEKEKSRASEI